MNSVLTDIEERRAFFFEEAILSDRAGQLTAEAAQAMRDIGIIKMLQPRNFGGLESSPQDFLRAVYSLSRLNPSAGWVSGVVGLHPWEVAQFSESMQHAVWGKNHEVWISSPYAPMGRVSDVDGGHNFSGRWSFSSGTDHCDWALLGALHESDLKSVLHVLIPREDYQIIDESWDVLGLKGTGSKDLVAEAALIRSEQILPFTELSHGNASTQWRDTPPLYRMPYVVLFPGAITAATLGIAQGALDQYLSSMKLRSQTESKLVTLAEVAATLEVAASTLFSDVEMTFETVSHGRSVSLDERIRIRRNQVWGVRASRDAINELHRIASSAGLRNEQSFSRFWRDLNVGANHATNYAEPILQGYGLNLLGEEIPGALRMGTPPVEDSIQQLDATERFAEHAH